MGYSVASVSVIASSPEAAVDRALSQYKDEYGGSHGISATGTKVVDPVTEPESYYGNEELNNYQGNLWGAPIVITPVISEDSVTRRTVTKVLTFTGEQWKANARDFDTLLHRRALISKAVKENVSLRAGERIESIKPNVKNTWTARDVEYGEHITRTSKVVTKATEGKAVTRYYIVHPFTDRLPTHKEMWEKGFDTQAEARKHMVEFIENNETVDEMEVVSVTRREDGSPLVLTKRDVSKVKYNAKIDLVKIAPNPKISEYVVSFWVHT